METITSRLEVPSRDEVSEKNQQLFDNLNKAVGFVPNIYAAMAHSENALGNYLQFSGGKTSFTKKEKEVIDLAVSQLNGCRYCQSAHTAIGKMNGFSDEEILEFRKGGSSKDERFNTLAKFSRKIAEKRGQVSPQEIEEFFAAGYTKEHLVDLVLAIGIITITNLFHNITEVEIDFPIAPEL